MLVLFPLRNILQMHFIGLTLSAFSPLDAPFPLRVLPLKRGRKSTAVGGEGVEELPPEINPLLILKKLLPVLLLILRLFE